METITKKITSYKKFFQTCSVEQDDKKDQYLVLVDYETYVAVDTDSKTSNGTCWKVINVEGVDFPNDIQKEKIFTLIEQYIESEKQPVYTIEDFEDEMIVTSDWNR